MTLPLVFHWWWLGVGAAILGIIIAALAPVERGSFMGWGYESPTFMGIVVIVITILSALYLLFGVVARALP